MPYRNFYLNPIHFLLMAIIEVSVVPIGIGTSLSKYVRESVKLLKQSGLRHEITSMGCNIEGEYDEIMKVIKQMHEKMFELGVKRVLTTIKIDDRRDKKGTIKEKIEAVKVE